MAKRACTCTAVNRGSPLRQCRNGRGLAVIVTAAVLTACSSMPVEAPLPVPASQPFSRSGENTPAPQWWRSFGDEQLDAVIALALSDNFDLAAAFQRLEAARAVARRERAARFLSLEAFAEGQSADNDRAGDDDELLSAGLAAAYEVDLWGRIGAAADAEALRANAAAADYQTAALSLTAEIALTWYRLAEADQSLALLEAQTEANEKLLQSLTGRFRGGQVRAVDVLRQRQLLEATRERLIVARAAREVLDHRLAVLLGQPPQAGAPFSAGGLPSLPPLPATGLPAQLLLRRPDVQSAYRLLQAADRDLAVAVASRYPRLNITASASTSTRDDQGLFDDWMRTLTADLLGPIVDGGRRRAEVARAEAVKAQRLAELGQASLTSFREVEDALVREARQQQRLASLGLQLDLQQAAYRQLQTAYFNGLTDFIDVLTALTDSQQLQRDLLIAQREVVEFRIALYRALAGPIDNTGGETAP